MEFTVVFDVGLLFFHGVHYIVILSIRENKIVYLVNSDSRSTTRPTSSSTLTRHHL